MGFLYKHKTEIFIYTAKRIETLDRLEKAFKEYRIVKVNAYGKLTKLTILFHVYRDSLKCESMFLNKAIKASWEQDLAIEPEFDEEFWS